jgi:hypothetical protein
VRGRRPARLAKEYQEEAWRVRCGRRRGRHRHTSLDDDGELGRSRVEEEGDRLGLDSEGLPGERKARGCDESF